MKNESAKNGAQRRRTGRPLKLADERDRQRLFNVLRAGGSRMDAATKLGVSHQTIKNEAKRDPTFLQGLMEAEIDGKLSLMVTVREAAKAGNWKAAAWMLERKYWREYAKRTPGPMTIVEAQNLVRTVVNCLLDAVPPKYHARLQEQVDALMKAAEQAKETRGL